MCNKVKSKEDKSMFISVADEQCLSDVGTLQCPEVPTNASSTTTCATQPSTTASTTASVSTEVTQNTALQLENKARRGEDEKDKGTCMTGWSCMWPVVLVAWYNLHGILIRVWM